MKNIALSVLIICLGLTVYSQGSSTSSFKFGVKAGMNVSKLNMNNTFSMENRKGYYGGIWARIGGPGTYLQPELYLSNKNSRIVAASGRRNDITFTSLDLPILIGTKIGTDGFGLRINTGPVITFMLNEEQKFDEAFALAFKGKFKNKAIAWQFGLGLDIGKLNIDGRYEAGLSQINSAGGYPPTRINLYTLGLGFAIF